MCAFRFIENIERYDSDSEDDDFPRVRPRNIRNRTNYFDYFDDFEFFRRFRLKKQTVLLVLELIENSLEFSSDRNSSVSPINQLLLTLRFYASGSHLITMGDLSGLSVSTSSRIVKRVSTAIANLHQTFIKFPTTDADRNSTKAIYYNIGGFPNVLGTIDCTHVKIQSPGGDDGELFRNRKGYFSLNVQTISSPNLEVMNIVARWPGSTHDSVIFQNSGVCHELETGTHGDSFLLGDSGYPLKRYLLTPFLHPRTDAQSNYNKAHITTRNTVERQYGVIKRRFPVLALGLRLQLETTTSVIVACAILHNICITEREEMPPNEVENIEQLIEDGQIKAEAGNNHNQYGTMRDIIVNNYFQN